MTIRNSNPWENGRKSGLVSIGTHKLFVSTAGPSRRPGMPVVIYITGCGSPIEHYVRLESLLSKFARTVFYDRAGYDRSEVGPIKRPTAEDTAEELGDLLRTLEIAPPYVLVSHSCGSVIARTFLDSHMDAVAGMVLADTSTELMYAFYPKIPSADLETVSEGVDWEEITHLQEEANISDAQWQAMIEASKRTSQKINEDIRGGARTLAAKKQFQNQPLGKKPLSVMRADFIAQSQLLYEEGIKRGDGTEEQRAGAREYILNLDCFDDQMRRSQLQLTNGPTRYVWLPGVYHDFPIRKPELIAEEVKWVLDQILNAV